MNTTGSTLTHLQCSKCDIEYSKDSIHGLSPCCSLPLFPKYDIDKAKTVFKQNDLIENTQRFTCLIERYIRQYPEQWIWMHDRWKTRPVSN